MFRARSSEAKFRVSKMTLPKIPVEILEAVMLELSPKDIYSASKVNQEWREVIENEVFWKRITIRDFGVFSVPFMESWKETYHSNLRRFCTPLTKKIIYLTLTFPFEKSSDLKYDQARICKIWFENLYELTRLNLEANFSFKIFDSVLGNGPCVPSISEVVDEKGKTFQTLYFRLKTTNPNLTVSRLVPVVNAWKKFRRNLLSEKQFLEEETNFIVRSEKVNNSMRDFVIDFRVDGGFNKRRCLNKSGYDILLDNCDVRRSSRIVC